VFLRATAKCFARLCHRLGVCLSVCLSDTLVSCIKMVQARITKSSLWAAPRSLVYRDKISCHWVQGFPSNEGVEKVYPLKRLHFAVIGSNNVKTVADRYIHAAYHNKHWWQAFGFIDIDDLERPWTPQREVFSEFFAIFGCSAHFNAELRRNGWRETKTTCVWNFQHSTWILAVQVPTPYRFKEAGAGGRQRQLPP